METLAILTPVSAARMTPDPTAIRLPLPGSFPSHWSTIFTTSPPSPEWNISSPMMTKSGIGAMVKVARELHMLCMENSRPAGYPRTRRPPTMLMNMKQRAIGMPVSMSRIRLPNTIITATCHSIGICSPLRGTQNISASVSRSPSVFHLTRQA